MVVSLNDVTRPLKAVQKVVQEQWSTLAMNKWIFGRRGCCCWHLFGLFWIVII